jgi:hypothetical protein
MEAIIFFFILMDVSVREDTKHAFFGEKWEVEISKNWIIRDAWQMTDK